MKKQTNKTKHVRWVRDILEKMKQEPQPPENHEIIKKIRELLKNFKTKTWPEK